MHPFFSCIPFLAPSRKSRHLSFEFSLWVALVFTFHHLLVYHENVYTVYIFIFLYALALATALSLSLSHTHPLTTCKVRNIHSPWPHMNRDI